MVGEVECLLGNRLDPLHNQARAALMNGPQRRMAQQNEGQAAGRDNALGSAKLLDE